MTDAAIGCLGEKDHVDYQFILTEMERYVRLAPLEQVQCLNDNPMAGFSGLRTAQGGVFPLAVEAQERFIQIALRGLEALGPEGRRHLLKSVVAQLQADFQAAILSGLDITGANAHDVFIGAIRKLEVHYTEITHYVPCAVVAHREVDEFVIGPVTLVLRDKFLKDHEAAIHKAAEWHDAPLTEKLLTRLRDFYDDFQWIACITVQPCHPEVSTERARVGIQRALDVFKLMVGSRRAPSCEARSRLNDTVEVR
jgi:hypothetical protein